MRKFILFYTLLCTMSVWALTIPQGTLYFDNSRTQYSHVRFVYGSNQRNETYALAMTQEGNKWRVDIPHTVNDMYRFTFVGGDIREGLYTQDFNTFKDSISHQAQLNRTATSEVQMNTNDIFVPESGDNWAQGAWMTLADWEMSHSTQPGTAQISGTLPVIYVNTKNSAPVTDTENQIKCTVYIDSESTEYASLGSATNPLAATIKGRGNYTWSGFDKKPYKLKFDVKQKVLGMPNNKHWCLMAGADDNLGFMRNPAGYMISEALQLRWTPRMRPVELVLNGQYQGLYFITEHVRIAAHRVRVREQAEGDTNPDSITGGWLVEIDNYSEPGNITFTEGNGQYVMVTIKEPENLSTAQRSYIENQIYTLNDALYAERTAGQPSPITQYLDIDEAAKYYLVQEIMEDCESYHGSCYLYKDLDSLGVADKWKFGPVWDFGNAYNRNWETWIYDSPIFAQYWIGQLATCPEFQQKVKEYWYVYYHDCKDSVRAQITTLATQIAQAAKNDAAVWNGTMGYNDNSNMAVKRNDFLSRYDWRIDWLYRQWGEGVKPQTYDVENASSQPSANSYRKILRDGQLYIVRGNRIYTVSGQSVAQ